MNDYSPRSMLIRAMRNESDNKPRSKQVEIGPSSVYSCRRQIWHNVNQTPKTNRQINILPSLIGTWIHEGIAKAIISQDPFGDNFLIEESAQIGDLPGHIDLYVENVAVVVDWKTSTKSKLKGKYFPSVNYIGQAQIYAYLLKHDKGKDVKQIAIVGVPRDGGIEDIVEFIADYDEEVALAAIAWLDAAKSAVEKPQPEMFVTFCSGYCPFFDESGEIGCPGIPKSKK